VFTVNIDEANQKPGASPRYRWPWVVLAFLIVGVALAVLWVSQEAARVRQLRDLNAPESSTAAQPVPTNHP